MFHRKGFVSCYNATFVYWKWPLKLYRLQLVLALMASFTANLAVGLSTCYGNVLPYVMSYIRVFSQSTDARLTDGVYAFVVQCVGYTGFILLGGATVRFVGPRILCILGGCLFVCGLCLTYFAVNVSYDAFLITYGVIVGSGTGLVLIASISCALSWLPQRRGIALGISTSGYGSAPLLYNFLITGYVNPHNLAPDYAPYLEHPTERYFLSLHLLMRVQSLFLVLAVVGGSMIAISSVFLVNPHPNYDAKRYKPLDNDNVSETITARKRLEESFAVNGKSFEDCKDFETGGFIENNYRRKCRNIFISQSHNISPGNKDFTPLQMMATVSFYILCIKSLLVYAIGAFAITLYKSFALEMVTDNDFYLTFAGALAAVFNILGRISLGLLEDLIDIYFVLILQSGLVTCLLFTFYATSVGGEIMFLIWVCALFFCVGGYYSIYPSAVAGRFGNKHASVNYGIVNLFSVVGELITAVVSQFLIRRIMWYGTFFVFGGISLLDFMLSVIYEKIQLI